ncbi:MAG: GGDEF domain-containing protein [Burkholderiaceae bacterium]
MYNTDTQIQILGQVMRHEAVQGALQALIDGLHQHSPVGGRLVWSPGSVQTAIQDMQGAQHVFLIDTSLEGGGQLIFFFPDPISSQQREGLDRFLGMAERWMHALREMDQLEASLGHVVSQDPLTGILNARTYAARVAQIANASPDGIPDLLALHLDLVQFKSVNDQLGDEIGDELLFAFADRIKRQMGPEDCFGRLGPDEFGLVFVGRGLGVQTAGFVERFVHWVQKPPIETSLWNGVRIGVADSRVEGLQAKELLLSAACAVRAAKVFTGPAFAYAGKSPQAITSDAS